MLTDPLNDQSVVDLIENNDMSIRRVVYRILSDKSQVEDIIQTVYENIFVRRRKIDPYYPFSVINTNPDSWITGYARNTALKVAKTKSNRRKHYKLYQAMQRMLGNKKVNGHYDIENIETALDMLPPKDREILNLRYYHMMRNDEVAKRMNITESRASQKKSAALVRLRIIVNELSLKT